MLFLGSLFEFQRSGERSIWVRFENLSVKSGERFFGMINFTIC